MQCWQSESFFYFQLCTLVFLVWPLLYRNMQLHVTNIPYSVNSYVHKLLNSYLFDVYQIISLL